MGFGECCSVCWVSLGFFKEGWAQGRSLDLALVIICFREFWNFLKVELWSRRIPLSLSLVAWASTEDSKRVSGHNNPWSEGEKLEVGCFPIAVYLVQRNSPRVRPLFVYWASVYHTLGRKFGSCSTRFLDRNEGSDFEPLPLQSLLNACWLHMILMLNLYLPSVSVCYSSSDLLPLENITRM